MIVLILDVTNLVFQFLKIQLIKVFFQFQNAQMIDFFIVTRTFTTSFG